MFRYIYQERGWLRWTASRDMGCTRGSSTQHVCTAKSKAGPSSNNHVTWLVASALLCLALLVQAAVAEQADSTPHKLGQRLVRRNFLRFGKRQALFLTRHHDERAFGEVWRIVPFFRGFLKDSSIKFSHFQSLWLMLSTSAFQNRPIAVLAAEMQIEKWKRNAKSLSRTSLGNDKEYKVF